MKKMIGAVLMALMMAACGDKAERSQKADMPAEKPSTPEAKKAVAPAWANLNEAIAATLPEMTDIQGASLDAGSAKLAVLGYNLFTWQDIQAVASTKHGLVMKDSDAERGKRLCAAGSVIEIEKDRSVPGKSIFNGGMFDDSGKLYRFISVKSTGEIMANSRARFCGIVTGQMHYQNSAGGTAHAVHLVGMFDLPENNPKTTGKSK